MTRLFASLSLVTLCACAEMSVLSAPIEGPVTRDADAFAQSFLDEMQARSFRLDREYCGYFGRDARGYIIATAPVVGSLVTCQPPSVSDSYNIFASYHSHAAYDPAADSEVPTSNDVATDLEEGLIGYVSTPGGRLWRNEGGMAVLLCGPGCIAVDPDFIQGDYGPVASRYTIKALQAREAKMPR